MLAAHGELDLDLAQAMRASLLTADQATRLVVVDFADVTFADSVIAGLLIAGSRRAARDSRELVVANAGGAVLRAFELLGTGHLLVDARRPLTARTGVSAG